MKLRHFVPFLIYLVFSFPRYGAGQVGGTPGGTRIIGEISSDGSIACAKAILLTYRDAKLYPAGGELRIEVPVVDHRFSMWIPSLASGNDARLSWVFDESTDSTEIDSALQWDYYYLLLGDSLVELSIKHRLKEARVVRGAHNLSRQRYNELLAGYAFRRDSLRDAFRLQRIDSSVYRQRMRSANAELIRRKKHFISENPRSLQSLIALEGLVQDYLKTFDWKGKDNTGLEDYVDAYYGLDSVLQLGERGRNLLNALHTAKCRKVIPFVGEMPDGRLFDLSSLQGTVFLIDFWGSWCGYCRKSHPHMKELYAKYKERGFEIVGVGNEFGAGEEAWERFNRAIYEDEIQWPQVLNDPSRQDIVAQYMITTYPSKFLVDREGYVVLRTGSDPERLLDAKLEELFGEMSGHSTDSQNRSYQIEEAAILKKRQRIYAYFDSMPADKRSGRLFDLKCQQGLLDVYVQLDSLLESQIRNCPHSTVSKIAFLNYLEALEGNIDEERARELLVLFSPEILKAGFRQEAERAIAIAKAAIPKIRVTIHDIRPGKKAPAFTQFSPEGKPVSLCDFEGRYVLLDFWASWCGPCREDNPKLVKLYDKFKGADFEIIGVSLDGGRDQWEDAIQADGMEWAHVSDLNGWDNKIATMYNVVFIPQNVLIGPDGTIVRTHLGLAELDAELTKLLKK